MLRVLVWFWALRPAQLCFGLGYDLAESGIRAMLYTTISLQLVLQRCVLGSDHIVSVPPQTFDRKECVSYFHVPLVRVTGPGHEARAQQLMERAMWAYSRGEMPIPALRLWLAGGALSDDEAPAPIITRDDIDTLCRRTWRFMMGPRPLKPVASNAANPEALDGDGGSSGSAPSAELAPPVSSRSRRLARRNVLRELQAPKPNHVGPATLGPRDAALPLHPQAAQPECESVGHRAPPGTAAADARAPSPLAPAAKKSRGEAGPVTRVAAQARRPRRSPPTYAKTSAPKHRAVRPTPANVGGTAQRPPRAFSTLRVSYPTPISSRALPLGPRAPW